MPTNIIYFRTSCPAYLLLINLFLTWSMCLPGRHSPISAVSLGSIKESVVVFVINIAAMYFLQQSRGQHEREAGKQMWNRNIAEGEQGFLLKMLHIEAVDKTTWPICSVSLFLQLRCLDTILEPRGAQSAEFLFILIF